MNPWGVESEWDRAGPPIGKRGRGGWWVNSSARAQAAGRGVYLKKLDFILTELNAVGEKKRFYILFLQLFQREIGIALAPHAHAHSTFPLPLVRLALRAWSFRCWYPSRRIQFQGADALATALLGQQRRLAVRGELAREVGPLGALDS
eukprot:scaffold31862_cov63-Phaeocystis_antarctica.AAC.5